MTSKVAYFQSLRNSKLCLTQRMKIASYQRQLNFIPITGTALKSATKSGDLP